jgi:hypothetical protein
MLFKEIIAVYSEIDKGPIIQNAKLLIGKAGGVYIYHSALKG